jgi:hypothetical protein
MSEQQLLIRFGDFIENNNSKMKKSSHNKKEGDKTNIKSDFKEFFIAETGSSIITSAEFE